MVRFIKDVNEREVLVDRAEEDTAVWGLSSDGDATRTLDCGRPGGRVTSWSAPEL